MSAGPMVTVAVITHNHESYVDQCLRSIATQTFRDLELVVVDDASTDATVERVRRHLDDLPFEANLIVNARNLGTTASHNRALAAARGTFLAAIDGDDYCEPDKVARQCASFETFDNSVAAVYSGVYVVDDDGTRPRRWFREDFEPAEGRIFDQLITGNFIPKDGVMVRTAAVREVGGYDESLFYEDYDLWLRLADRYNFRYVPGEVATYRWTPDGMSRRSGSATRMDYSRARLLLKWANRDERTRRIVQRRAWQNARRTFAYAPALGRPLVRDIAATFPSAAARAASAAATIPGSAFVLRGVLGARDRRARSKKDPRARHAHVRRTNS